MCRVRQVQGGQEGSGQQNLKAAGTVKPAKFQAEGWPASHLPSSCDVYCTPVSDMRAQRQS